MEDLKAKLKKILQEADLYRNQGLLNESKQKYKQAAILIKNTPYIKNKTPFLESIIKKVTLIERELKKIHEKSEKPDISTENQNLIKKLFSFSDDSDKDKADLEGALTLAKFGLFEKAIFELSQLLSKESIRITAAQNILRCYVANNELEKAISQYQNWLSEGKIPIDQLQKMIVILEGSPGKNDKHEPPKINIEESPGKKISKQPPAKILIDDEINTGDFEEFDIVDSVQKTNNNINIGQIDKKEGKKVEFEEFDLIDSVGKKEKRVSLNDYEIDDYLEIINAIEIIFAKGPQKGKKIKFTINIQTGNSVNLIISNEYKDIVKELEVGTKFDNLYCHSPISDFKGKGIVTAKNLITSGPKKDNFSLDIKIEK